MEMEKEIQEDKVECLLTWGPVPAQSDASERNEGLLQQLSGNWNLRCTSS